MTGHPKGAAAAWMTNGLLQAMTTGKIPGNRNADNIDVKLCGFEHLIYPNKTIQTSGINACMLKSFGFGQAGAEILLVNPKYLYATMSVAENSLYAETRTARHAKFVRSYQKVITGKEPLVQIKNRAPYTETQQNQVYLNPRARCVYDPIAKDYVYPDDIVTPEQARSMLLNARAARARASSISRKSDDNERGETKEEIIQVMDDLRSAEVDFITIGQYLQPSVKHHPLNRYYHPVEFKELETIAKTKGFLLVSSSPLTRSSYHADEDFRKLQDARNKKLECHQHQ